MTLDSAKRLASIHGAINRKLKAKAVSVGAGVRLLCKGYSGVVGGYQPPAASAGDRIQAESISRVRAVLDEANATTGYNNSNLTSAVQRLCNFYGEGNPLYSFGALSDLHMQYNTGREDLQRAFTWLRERVPFCCVCGDLISFATQENMTEYARYVEQYAGDMPVLACAGNHETYPDQGVGGVLDEELWKTCTGTEPNHAFEYGGDLFLFLSMKTETTFADGGIAWLEEQLEANQHRRCFVFQHLHNPDDSSCDPSHKYSNMLAKGEGPSFMELVRKYPNVVWFNGHTHLTLMDDRYPISEKHGYKSVHIPSLSGIRFYDSKNDVILDYCIDKHGNKIWGAEYAEGYLVDVYKNHIVLRGIDFAAGPEKNQVLEMPEEIYIVGVSGNDQY